MDFILFNPFNYSGDMALGLRPEASGPKARRAAAAEMHVFLSGAWEWHGIGNARMESVGGEEACNST